MSNNSRHRLEITNRFPVKAFLPWLVIAFLFVLEGMTWVHYRNQLVHRGASISNMEKELVELSRKNDALEGRIAQLLTYPMLQKACTDGVIKMTKISPSNVVHVPFPATGGLATEIHAGSTHVTIR